MLLDVAEGLTDVAIIPAQLKLPDGVVAREIGALQWRCFGRRGHPAFDEWGAETWSRYPHLVVRVGDQLDSPVNIAAGAAGLERTVSCWVPNFSAIAPVLAATDLLATVPGLAMADTPSRYGLEHHPVPFSIAPLPHALVWSAARAREPEIEWLIERLWPVLEREFGDPTLVPRDHFAHRSGRQAGNGR